MSKIRKKQTEWIKAILIILALILGTIGALSVIKLATITPGGEIDAKISYIKIKSTSKPIYPKDPRGFINYFWVNYLKNEVFDKEIPPENKPRYASLWEVSSGNYYIEGKFDPDGQAFGLPNLYFRAEYAGSVTNEYIVKSSYYAWYGSKEEIIQVGEFFINLIFAFQADVDTLQGYTEEQSYYDAEIGLDITSYKHPILEAYLKNEKLFINYLSPSDRKHVQVVIKVPNQIVGVDKVIIVNLLRILLDTGVKLEPTTTLTITAPTQYYGTYTVATTKVVYQEITRTIEYYISGGTIVKTSVVTIPSTITKLGTATITVTKPTTITVNKVITTTAIAPFTLDKNMLPIVLIVAMAVIFFVLLYYVLSLYKKKGRR